jgi:hypothetical protein
MSIAFYYYGLYGKRIDLGVFNVDDLTPRELMQLKLIQLEKAILDNVLVVYYTQNNMEYKLDYYNLEG